MLLTKVQELAESEKLSNEWCIVAINLSQFYQYNFENFSCYYRFFVNLFCRSGLLEMKFQGYLVYLAVCPVFLLVFLFILLFAEATPLMLDRSRQMTLLFHQHSHDLPQGNKSNPDLGKELLNGYRLAPYAL